MRVPVFILLMSLLNLCHCVWKYSDFKEHPHFVTLSIVCLKQGSSETLKATSRGAILDRKLVLTSATYLYECDPSKTNIVVTLRPGVKSYSATKFTVHEEFNPPASATSLACGSNIALVLLEESLEFSDKVKQVAVSQKDIFKAGKKANLPEWIDPSTDEWETPLVSTLDLSEPGLIIHVNGTMTDEDNQKLQITIHTVNTWKYRYNPNIVYFQFRVSWERSDSTVVYHLYETSLNSTSDNYKDLVEGAPFDLWIRCNADSFEVKLNNGIYKRYQNVLKIIGKELYMSVKGEYGKTGNIGLSFIHPNKEKNFGNALIQTRVTGLNFNTCKRDNVEYLSDCEDYNMIICVQGKFDDHPKSSSHKYSDGSPLVVDNYLLAGIGLQTDGHARYRMFTNVSFYYDWIKNTAKKFFYPRYLNIEVTPTNTSTTTTTTPTTTTETEMTSSDKDNTVINANNSDKDNDGKITDGSTTVDSNGGTKSCKTCVRHSRYNFTAVMKFWGVKKKEGMFDPVPLVMAAKANWPMVL